MSCGNRFQCGITRFQKHSFTPDKPSNVELHNENQKRLNDLLKAREEIDKQFLTSTAKPSKTTAQVTSESMPELEPIPTNTTYLPWTSNETPTATNFTPWKVPSVAEFQSKLK